MPQTSHGLVFSGYRKELTARGFRRAYEGLRADCPALSPFADPHDLIAFFHDQAADMDRKDAILFALINRYQRDPPTQRRPPSDPEGESP